MWKDPTEILKEEEISPIYLAIYHIRDDELEDLLNQEKNNPNFGVKSSYTPLHYAAEIGHDVAAEMLISHGADINARYVKQPLTELNQTDNGQNNSSDLEEYTPLQLAVMNNNNHVILVLLRSGAHMDNISQERRREIYLHALNEDEDELYQLLRPHINGLNEFNQSQPGMSIGYQPHIAPICDRHRWLQQLLQQGIDPNTPGSNDCTPLDCAVSREDIVAINILLAYGANVHAVDDQGNTALQSVASRISTASWSGRLTNNAIKTGSLTEVIKTLLICGSNPNSCNHRGRTVFDFVSLNQMSFKDDTYYVYLDEDALEWLLNYGLDWRNNNKYSDILKTQLIKTYKFIVEYNLKRQLAGLKFQAEALTDSENLTNKDFRERCVAEIEKMKMHRLFENMTMYGFMHCSTKRSLVTLFRKKEINQVYMQNSYKIEYPIYKNLIEYNFIQGEKYGPVYDCAFDNLNKLCEYRLPNVILDEIMDYIDKNDMENLLNCLK